MKVKHKIILYLLISFFGTNCFAASPYAALSPSLPYIHEIPAGTTISSFDDFKRIIDEAYNNLQYSLTLNVPSTDLQKYSAILNNYIGLQKYHLKCTYTHHSIILIVDLTYKQAYKISQVLKNNSLYYKLDKSDLKLLNTAKNIISQITTPSMSEYEKELAIHNYIITNTSYDYNNLISDTLSPAAYTAAGVLYNHSAVCEGYSEAMKLLLNLCNIDCEIVAGQTADGNHAWNAVKINGDWYMLDVTFDDPVSLKNGKRTEVLTYDYFNITNKQLSKDHKWNTVSYPIATATQFNYYIYSHLFANNYSEFKQIITNQLNAGKKTAICYVKDYSPNTYNLSFLFKYSATINYSVPSSREGCISIYLS